MRCLALEKVLESNEQKFEYLGDGKYKFWDSHSVRTEYCGPAEYQDEYENSLEKSIDAYYVKYEKQNPNNKDQEYALLIWDYQHEINCDIPDFYPTLYRWCNAKNGKNNYTYYLDDDSMLHVKLVTILPDDAEAAEAVCQKAWDEFKMAEIITLMAVMNERNRLEPFSLKPQTEYEKMITKNNLGSTVKAVPVLSTEECFEDMQKQLQTEINEVKVSAAAKEISAEEADAKIKELERLMQMLHP